MQQNQKEIDAGGTVFIVGYVTPTSGTQTPYYVVWNPWWDTTFYLSANAKTFNLGGVKYKWLRTWHNWKTTSPASRSLQSVDPEVGKQKVASTANPMALKENINLSLDLATHGTFTNTLQKFNNNPKDILSQNVAQYGSPVMWRGSFNAYYGYQSTIPKKGQRRIMKIFSYNTLETELYFDTNEATVWRDDVKNMNDYQYNLRKSGIALAYEVPLMLVTGGFVKAGLVGASAIKKITSYSGVILAGIGIIGDDNPIAIATTLYNYYNLEVKMIKDAERCYFADGPV